MNKKIGLIAGSAALLMGIGGVSYAAIPDSDDGEFHACVKDSADANGNGHMVRMLDKDGSESCASGWSEKLWNQTGPTGSTGPAGSPGPTGATGPTGPAGAPGPGLNGDSVYTNGSSLNVSPGDRVTVDTFCGNSTDLSSGGGSRIDQISSGDHLYLEDSHQFRRASDNRTGWRVTVSAPSANSDDVFVFSEVQCLRTIQTQ